MADDEATKSPEAADQGSDERQVGEEAAANDAQAAAGGSDAPMGEADLEPTAAEEAPAAQDGETSSPGDGGDGDGFDVDAAQGRLAEVGEQIDEAKKALADVEQEVEPEPDGPPIASGEGAANAPPG